MLSIVSGQLISHAETQQWTASFHHSNVHIQGCSRWAKNILLMCTIIRAKNSLQTRPKSILILGRVRDRRKEQDSVLFQTSWRSSLCKDVSPVINRQYLLFPHCSLLFSRNSHTLLIVPGRKLANKVSVHLLWPNTSLWPTANIKHYER